MKSLLIALPILAICATSAHALPEANFAEVGELLENRAGFFSLGSFRGEDDKAVSFVKFGNEAGARGCVVLSPGQGEASMKYIEVAHDLVQNGFSPVYSIDHRGQGFSERLLADKNKSHVDKFSDYAIDFETFVNNTVLQDPACRGHRMFLLAHSMGGAIATVYLENMGAGSPFQKAAMSAPMMKIAFPGNKTEDSVIRETWIACHTFLGPKCDDFAPGKGPYVPGSPFQGNPYTHSAARFGLKAAIFGKWKDIQVGGPTVQWVSESAKANKELRREKNAARIAVPLLILQAGNDSIVDNAGQDEICPLVDNCRIEKISGANHEILMESDSLRNPAFAKLVDFFTAP